MRRSGLRSLDATTFTVLLAGGIGSRLGGLTRRHSKPALPFGGQYRNVDFTLSNCVNSGLSRIALLTQYNAHSLIQHVHLGWSFLSAARGELVQVWPAQQRRGGGWYSGTADAVRQNLDLIAEHRPRDLLVLAGDHVYKMDYLPMLEAHAASGAAATVGCIEVPVEEASAFGVIGVDAEGWITRFEEKPERPTPLPRDGRRALVSMGIYAFDYRRLAQRLAEDAADPSSRHDFGRDILPALLREERVLSHPLRGSAPGERPYWRDVGTLDAYWGAHMDLLDEPPAIDLHDERWPVWTHQPQRPPPRFVGEGVASRSIVAPGASVAGRVARSIVSAGCRIGAGASVEDSVLLDDVEVGRDCRLRRVIVDGGCRIPDGALIGHDPLLDAECFETTPAGVALVTAAGLEEAARRGAWYEAPDAWLGLRRARAGAAPVSSRQESIAGIAGRSIARTGAGR